MPRRSEALGSLDLGAVETPCIVCDLGQLRRNLEILAHTQQRADCRILLALKGFAVAGEDKKWVWADARIDCGAVVVSSEAVARPIAVRYAWANNPECNLYDKEGLPAGPFRTDGWPVVTQPRK